PAAIAPTLLDGQAWREPRWIPARRARNPERSDVISLPCSGLRRNRRHSAQRWHGGTRSSDGRETWSLLRRGCAPLAPTSGPRYTHGRPRTSGAHRVAARRAIRPTARRRAANPWLRSPRWRLRPLLATAPRMSSRSDLT